MAALIERDDRFRRRVVGCDPSLMMAKFLPGGLLAGESGRRLTMDEVIDVAEVRRLERKAWEATERSQELARAMMTLEEKLAEARAAYEQAEAKEKAAWAEVHALFGGSWARWRDWSIRQTG
jgi:hypothetical protein